MLKELGKLQAIDLEIKKLHEQEAQEFAKLYETEKKIKKLREEETLFQKQLESIENKKRELELELKRMEGEIEKSQEKSLKIKTNEEYHAILTEIETKKKIISDLEDQILEVIEVAENTKKQHRNPGQTLQGLEGEFNTIKEALAERQQDLHNKMSDKKKEREAFAYHIPSDILSKYNLLIENRNGIAVVQCKDTICYGCFMGIPPQMYNQLKRGDSLNFCPSCQRFIYYYELNLGTT